MILHTVAVLDHEKKDGRLGPVAMLEGPITVCVCVGGGELLQGHCVCVCVSVFVVMFSSIVQGHAFGLIRDILCTGVCISVTA